MLLHVNLSSRCLACLVLRFLIRFGGCFLLFTTSLFVSIEMENVLIKKYPIKCDAKSFGRHDDDDDDENDGVLTERVGLVSVPFFTAACIS